VVVLPFKNHTRLLLNRTIIIIIIIIIKNQYRNLEKLPLFTAEEHAVTRLSALFIVGDSSKVNHSQQLSSCCVVDGHV
jgi:hypothetical protein